MEITLDFFKLIVAGMGLILTWLGLCWGVFAFLLKKISDKEKAYLQAVKDIETKLESRLTAAETSAHERINWIQQEYVRREELSQIVKPLASSLDTTNRRLDELMRLLLQRGAS